MNAAQRLLKSFGVYDAPVPLTGGTPARKRWGKDRSYKPVIITPERQLSYMHAHARRRAMEAECSDQT